MLADVTIKNEADRFRQKHGLGHRDPVIIKSLLLKLKVITLFKPLQSENLSGIALKIDNYRSMLINSNKSVGHQNFTALHELYHLCVQDDFTYMLCNPTYSNRENIIERHANRFASFLLLPEEGVIDLIPRHEQGKNKISLATLLEIEQYYGSSRAALLYRLKGLGLIDDKYADRYGVHIIMNARLYGYNTSLYSKDAKEEVVGDYGKLAKRLFDNEIISESHFASLMKEIGICIDENIAEEGC